MKQVAPASRFVFTQNHCIFIILLIAALLRLPGLSGEWQYDEIWTLLNFTELDTFQILTDVSLPNNHPVNTLILKLLRNISEARQIIRFGVFAAGLWVVYLAVKLAALASEDNNCAKYSAGLLAAATPALILFSVTARGYIYQLAGLMLCVNGLLEIACGRKTRYSGVKIVAGGVLAFLSVSSGIMFLAVIAAAYLLLAPKSCRWDKTVWFSGGILLLAALGYYLPLFEQLRCGQQWGIEIMNFSGLIRFGFTTLKAHLPPFTALLALCGVICVHVMRKLFLFALLPLIMALVTKGGPERVYLVLTMLFIVMGGCGFAGVCEKFPEKRKIFQIIFLCGVILNSVFVQSPWQIPCPAAEMKQIMLDHAENVLPVAASTAGFPVKVNEPEIAKAIEHRAAFPEKLLMLNCADGVFNGADIENSEQQMSFPVSGTWQKGRVPGYMYKLVPIEKLVPGMTVLAIFSGSNVPAEFLQLPGKKLRLNLWLNQRMPVFIGNFVNGDVPYFEGVRYFQIGEKND